MAIPGVQYLITVVSYNMAGHPETATLTITEISRPSGKNVTIRYVTTNFTGSFLDRSDPLLCET
jgi:hypothetical protein